MSLIKNIKFVRFGGLSPVKQDHYLANTDSFHNPPVKLGIYAFPHGYEEFFLLGSTDDPSHISGKSAWLKDENGNLLIEEEHMKYIGYDKGKEQTEYSDKLERLCRKLDIAKKYLRSAKKDGKFYITYLKKPKIFDYKGEIWHHLGDMLKPHEIIEKKKSWYKTTYENYIKAFNKTNHEDAKEIFSIEDFGGKDINGFKVYITDKNLKKIDAHRNLPMNKYHLEVFIEKI
jgi:hypothetical protein